MHWSSWSEFVSMGGYGFYVWGAYAVAAICIAAELWWLRRRARTLQRRLGLNAEFAPGTHETKT